MKSTERVLGGECLRQAYYNMYDCGRLVGAYTASDLQVMIHCSRQVPERCAAEGRAYQNRYTFERIEGEGGQTDWECVTGRLKSSGYDLSRIRITGPETGKGWRGRTQVNEKGGDR